MFKVISKFILYKIWGWKIEGNFPKDTPKYIAIGAPHTSNWDFILGLLSRSILGADIKFIAKKSLFLFPYGWLFRLLGGYPIDRKKNRNYVDAMIDLFNSKEHFAVAITPEGTRNRVDQFKSGFYYIAKGANIPIVITIFDASNKVFKILPPLPLSGNFEQDMEKITQYFRGIKGINPEQGVFF